MPRTLTALITAAGHGSRFFGAPGTDVLKPLQPLAGRAIIDFVIDLAVAAADHVVVAVPRGTTEAFTSDPRRADRVEWQEYEQGIGVLETLQLMLDAVAGGDVLAMLGDDISITEQPAAVRDALAAGAWAVQGVVAEHDLAVLSDTCEVDMDGDRIRGVREKPPAPRSPWRGCGLYGLSEAAASELRAFDPRDIPGLCEAYDLWGSRELSVIALQLVANVNVNWPADLARAGEVVSQHRATIDSWQARDA